MDEVKDAVMVMGARASQGDRVQRRQPDRQNDLHWNTGPETQVRAGALGGAAFIAPISNLTGEGCCLCGHAEWPRE